jgi:DNA-binding MarR family transcriptional regulator
MRGTRLGLRRERYGHLAATRSTVTILLKTLERTGLIASRARRLRHGRRLRRVLPADEAMSILDTRADRRS